MLSIGQKFPQFSLTGVVSNDLKTAFQPFTQDSFQGKWKIASLQGELDILPKLTMDVSYIWVMQWLYPVSEPGPPVMIATGPVQPSAVIVLAQFEDPNEAALTSFDDVGVVRTGSSLDEIAAGVRQARAFAGHAGWGPGQLDAEIERDDWILEPARLEDAFSTDPRELWSTVLTRKGGSYALVARMPADPSSN